MRFQRVEPSLPPRAGQRPTLTALSLVAVVLVAASCQLVAGVRNDGELEGSSASTSSAGGATSSSTDASSSSGSGDASSSSTSMVPLCSGSPCKGACIDEICYIASCVDMGGEFDVFPASETAGKKFGDTLAAVVSQGKAVVAVVDSVANELLVRDVDDLGGTGAVTTFPLGANPRFTRGRFAGTKIALQGRMNDEVGEIRFDYLSGGVPTNGAFVSFGKPAPCGVDELVERVEFAQDGAGDVIYAASCGEPNVSYKLVLGGENDPGALVASGAQPTQDLRLEAYAFTHDTHVVITGSGAVGEQPHVRAGASAGTFGPATPLRLSAGATTKPATFLLTKQVVASQDFVFWGADVTLAQMPTSQLWSGVFADPATLGQSVPPPGFAPFGELLDEAHIQSDVGTPGQMWSDPLGFYLPMTSVDEHHVVLSWVSPEGVPYIASEPVHFSQVPFIRATAVSPIGLDRVIVTWIEENSGIWSVRGKVKDCTAVPR